MCRWYIVRICLTGSAVHAPWTCNLSPPQWDKTMTSFS